MAQLEGVPTIAEMALQRAQEGLATSDIELIGKAVVTLCEREFLRERPPIISDLERLNKALSDLVDGADRFGGRRGTQFERDAWTAAAKLLREMREAQQAT